MLGEVETSESGPTRKSSDVRVGRFDEHAAYVHLVRSSNSLTNVQRFAAPVTTGIVERTVLL